MIKFSIVIITFNSQYFIGGCLRSIFKQDFDNYEMIIVDNASRDNTGKVLKRYQDRVKLITNKVNRGSACARNQAFKLAQGKWILSLDADLFLGNRFLNIAAEVTDEVSRKVGMIQPKVLNFDRTYINTCGIYLSRWRRFYDLGRGRQRALFFKKPAYIYGASSACCLYRRQMLEQIKDNYGYLDRRFFFLVEDVDLCWRARKQGWLAYFTPRLQSFHYTAAAPIKSSYRQFLCWRNRYYMIFKNEGAGKYLAKILPALFYDSIRLLFLLFTNKDVRQFMIKAGRKN